MQGKLILNCGNFGGLGVIGKKVANHCLKSNLEG